LRIDRISEHNRYLVTMHDIYIQLAEIFEADQVTADDILSEFDYWDSLTVLSILAMLDAKYGVNLTAADVRAMKSAGDLVAAVGTRKAS
jgi:acyl carrier protein